jgi:hypothetical protein
LYQKLIPREAIARHGKGTIVVKNIELAKREESIPIQGVVVIHQPSAIFQRIVSDRQAYTVGYLISGAHPTR